MSSFRLVCLGLGGMFLAGCVTVAPTPRPTASTDPSPPTAALAAPVAMLTIDASRRLQTIDGFGASTFGNFEAFERGYFHSAVPKGVTYRTTPEQRAAILSTAVRELGLTHLRLWLPPEDEEPPRQKDNPEAWDWSAYNWAGASGKPAVENMRANRANGLAGWGEFLNTTVPLGLKNWIVTPAVMPDWLRRKFNEHAGDEFDRYADWAVAHLLHLKQQTGYEAPFWSLHNEPDHLGWTEPDFWHKLIRATGARFRREGLATRLVVPDSMRASLAVALLPALLESAETRQYIGALAYHHYGNSGDGPQPFMAVSSGANTAELLPQLENITGAARALAAIGTRYELPSWQTETAYYPAHYQGLSEWEIGRARANEIYYELTSGAAAVEGMFLFWVDAVDPRFGVNVRSEGHPIVLLTDGKKVKRWAITKDAGAVFAHYGRFVRPGDRRVDCVSADPLIHATAFYSEAQRRCVVVAINNATQPRSLAIQINGLPWEAPFCGALLTTEKVTLRTVPVETQPGVAHSGSVLLPPASVCTLVWSEAPLTSLALPADILVR